MCTICAHLTSKGVHILQNSIITYIPKAQSPCVNNDLCDKLMILSDCNHAETVSEEFQHGHVRYVIDENSKC